MTSIPIYIKSLMISGVKTFSEPAELKFANPSGEIANWTLILGQNGIGKSTLLQCIAWMQPTLPVAADKIDELKATPLINNEKNEVLEGLVSRLNDQNIKAEIKSNFVAKQKLKSIPLKTPIGRTTSITIVLDQFKKLDDVVLEHSEEYKDIFYKNEIIILGYSASRILGKENLNKSSLLDTIGNFIIDQTELYDAEEILRKLSTAYQCDTEPTSRAKYMKVIVDIKKMLADCLSNLESIGSVNINLPNTFFNEQRKACITMSTKQGMKIAFVDFSLGYRTVISLIIDLAWRMFTKFEQKVNDPLKEPAIVLVDEIDLHLHPKWQVDIMQKLSSHFPNVQFIATAHSPLMVQAALEYNYAVVAFDEDEKTQTINNRPEDLDGWRVDQILTSNLFGMVSARGKQYDDLILQRENLLKKKKLSPKDNKLLAEIDANLSKFPAGENIDEIKKNDLITRLYNRVVKQGVKLKSNGQCF